MTPLDVILWTLAAAGATFLVVWIVTLIVTAVVMIRNR